MRTTAEDKRILHRIWEFEIAEGKEYLNDQTKYLAWRAAVTFANFDRYVLSPPVFSSDEVI